MTGSGLGTRERHGHNSLLPTQTTLCICCSTASHPLLHTSSFRQTLPLAPQIACSPTASEVLQPQDVLSLLMAALCHDLDHDGYSNTFHVNRGSE